MSLKTEGQDPTKLNPGQDLGDEEPDGDGGGDPKPESKGSEGVDLAEMRKLRNENARRRKEAEALQARLDSIEAEKLKEAGRYKELYEAEQAKAMKIANAAKARHLDLLVRQKKSEYGVPSDLLDVIYVPLDGVEVADDFSIVDADALEARIKATVGVVLDKIKVATPVAPVAPSPIQIKERAGSAPQQGPRVTLENFGRDLIEKVNKRG